MGTIKEDFDALFSIFCELNASTKLLSTTFGIFLLASIAAQFVVSLKLFYTLFLSFNGFIKFSFFLVSSALFWIAFQFATFFMYIAGCEKFQKELMNSSKLLCRLKPAKYEEHEKVNLIWSKFQRWNLNLKQIRLQSQLIKPTIHFISLAQTSFATFDRGKSSLHRGEILPHQLPTHNNVRLSNHFIFDRYHPVSFTELKAHEFLIAPWHSQALNF